MAPQRVRLLGVEIDNVTLEEAAEVIFQRLLGAEGRGRYVVTPNATQIVQLQRDTQLQAIYRQADLVVADGMPVIWLSRLLGLPLKERVTGADLLPMLCAKAAAQGYRVFFLGAKAGVAAQAAAVLKALHPQLRVAGTYSPPWGFEEDPEEGEKIQRTIKASRPDILFVALGFPKQERWIYQCARRCGVPVSLGVGAALDFVAGSQRRAPAWVQNLGLEWLFRLLKEPRRLWYRYLVLGSRFCLLAAREVWKLKRKG